MADLLSVVVIWVAIFDPHVTKIGCDDGGMWHAYLLLTAAIFFRIRIGTANPCKTDAILCHASVEYKMCLSF